ncbi:sugar MFS transporter [Parabacteroides provencensis]|uniref:sugar MFS transporter n=1 Tax=Parabacteroides provencensis TaxID=1944636 RepID=UPI000C15DAEF|nr:sugar MFS transporter [Parabacteroides provencensis]
MSVENTAPIHSKRTMYMAITIVGMMFFIFGFVSWVNAILIPYFRIACELTHFQSYLVTFSFYIAYLVMSVPASYVLKRAGFKKGIMYGFFCMAAGALLFVPAALMRTYLIFLIGLFSIGTGLTILQAAANPYITIVGPIESAAKRISIMGICNKFAGIIAPLIFAAVILKVSDAAVFDQLDAGFYTEEEKNLVLDDLICRVIWPYTILSVFLFAVGIFIRYSVLPEINQEEENKEEASSGGTHTSIFQFPYLILGAFAMFLHVGTQVIAIDTIIGYAGSMGINLLEAKVFPSYTLTATIFGYMLGIVLIPKYVSQTRAFQFCCILGLIFSLGVALSTHIDLTLFGHEANLSIWFLVGLGFPNSLIYAGIWPLSIKGLGRFTKIGSSLLVMGLCGNAVLPLAYGHLADMFSIRHAYWILAPCYLYLIFFAVYGHKIKSWSFKTR